MPGIYFFATDRAVGSSEANEPIPQYCGRDTYTISQSGVHDRLSTNPQEHAQVRALDLLEPVQRPRFLMV